MVVLGLRYPISSSSCFLRREVLVYLEAGLDLPSSHTHYVCEVHLYSNRKFSIVPPPYYLAQSFPSM